MRAFRSFRSPIIAVVALCAAACGGSPPPTPAAPEAPSATPEAAASDTPSAVPASKPAADDEAWAGEKTSKTDKVADNAPGDKPAEPASADAKGPETRTMDVIRKLVMDNRKAARKCYEDARRDLKDLQGNLVIHFVLDPDGKVKLAELNEERSTLKSPAVVNCVIGVIKGIPFPKSSRAMETSANYPFNFTP
ncbi:MAG: AgmX/PglI C-terminal domain-containing protein [Polyangiaceae bacterium]